MCGHPGRRIFERGRLVWSLLCTPQSLAVFRAAFFLTLALTLGVTNSAPLFCQWWCDRPPGADTCTHNGSTTQIVLTGRVDCASVDLPATAAIRDDSTRSAAASDHHDIAIDPSNNAHTVTSRYAAATAAARLIAGNTSRVIALRI
jgi:hypothetical protein